MEEIKNMFGMRKSSIQKLSMRFADGGGNGSAGTGEESGQQDNAAEKNNPEPSFDDILKNKDYQSEFDKRISKALETAKAKWEAETQTKITEAQKLAKMNAEQKAQYEKDRHERELAEREANITKRELQATAKETLSEKGLPVDLYQTLDYTNADSCTKSIEAVEKAFKAAVEKAVDDRVKQTGGTPKTDNNKNNKDPFLVGLGL